MISVRQDTAPEAQEMRQANLGWRGYPFSRTSTASPFGRQREHGGQGRIAIARRRVRRLGFQVRHGSYSSAYRVGFAAVGAGQFIGLVHGLASRVERHQRNLVFRGLHVLDLVAFINGVGHVDVSCSDSQHIGPMALNVNTPSDNGGMPRNHPLAVGTRAPHNSARAVFRFPARKEKPASASNATLMHTRDR